MQTANPYEDCSRLHEVKQTLAAQMYLLASYPIASKEQYSRAALLLLWVYCIAF